MRQVKFPLKLKLLALMLVLIAISLTVFVGIALKIFREDKSAYIFETLLNKASSGQVILSQKLGASSPFQIQNAELMLGDSTNRGLLEKALEDDSIFSTKVVIPEQSQFFQFKKDKLAPISPNEEIFLSDITKKSLHQAVREIELGGEKVLYAYDYNPVMNYAYIVSLPVKKAYEVTTYLINKSILYGCFILGMAMLVSVFLARPLTSQLETLFSMTQQIAKGNFDQRVNLKGHDEVGALSDSINDMADKIVIYMDEMKEKSRLENEVQVAQLVQSSFFPKRSISDSTLSTYGHFEPATECGGDWWGYFDHEDWHVFFIADATGHGVPAALLTATINCCKSGLSFILESRPEILSQPNEILRFMNQAVCGAGKEIQVTCFVASFNRKTKDFIYSNSSHTPPLLFNGLLGDITKDNFQPLIDANGPRLGQKVDAQFESKALKLQTHDIIFFYTDGLTEAESIEQIRWGERRLVKSLILHGQKSPEEMIEGVMKDFRHFITERPLNDDITAVAMKVVS